jgi:hypothetical protein
MGRMCLTSKQQLYIVHHLAPCSGYPVEPAEWFFDGECYYVQVKDSLYEDTLERYQQQRDRTRSGEPLNY